MPLQSPTLDEIADIAEGYGLSLDESDLESFQGLMRGTLESYARLDELTEELSVAPDDLNVGLFEGLL